MSQRVLVGILEHLVHILAGLGLAQEANEALVLQVSRNILQGSEMITRLVLGRYQQERKY